MKNFQEFIGVSIPEIDKVFEELEHLFNDYRFEGINMQFDSRVELKDAHQFTKDIFDKVEENLIRLNRLITTAVVRIMAEENSEEKNDYLLTLAEANLSIAMKKNNLYTDLYEDFRPIFEESKEFLAKTTN